MTTDVDTILRRVAAGELSPDDALPLLDAANAAAAPAPGAPAPRAALPARPEVRIRAPYRSVHVIGDPNVHELVVTGPHHVRREGSLTIVENLAPSDAAEEGFSFSNLPWGLARARDTIDRLMIRVNPTMAIDAELTANDAHFSGCDGPLHIVSHAGAVKLDRVRGSLDIEAHMSSVKGSAGVTGDSRIWAEQSSVALSLLEGSDLRITGHNRLSKIVLPGAVTKGGITEGERSEVVLGTGRATLVIDALMSSVRVSVA